MSSDIKDYYVVLGVERDADADEIKKAFRKKARECHPDVCKDEDSEERFKEINEAYEVLSDPRKRDVYDRFGTADPRAGGFDNVAYEDIFGMGMEDVFSMFFGGQPRSGRRARRDGRDMATQVGISLEEAATGGDREIEIQRDAPCDACDGKGSANGEVKTCPDCGGQGRVTQVRQTMLGQMRTMAPCPACAETGEIVDQPCSSCGGLGRSPKVERVSIPISAGVRDGATVRVPGMGEAGLRGAAGGDLQVTVRVAPHESLYRDGNDLHGQVRVPLETALLGGDVRFAGLMFEETARVPAGSNHGDVVKVKGRGMPRTRGKGAGDLYVHVALDIPKKLSSKEREIVERLAAERDRGDGPATVDRVTDWLGHR